MQALLVLDCMGVSTAFTLVYCLVFVIYFGLVGPFILCGFVTRCVLSFGYFACFCCVTVL